MQRIFLDRLKFRLGTKIPKYELTVMGFNQPEYLMSFADAFAVEVEVEFLGKEVRTETVEKKTETGQTTSETESHTTAMRYKPLTWFDHALQTLHPWLTRHKFKRLGLKVQKRVRWDSYEIGITRIVKTTRPTTKHITIEKHFHLCPHLNAPDHTPHVCFAAGQPVPANAYARY